jgi:hypothetical protein
MNDVEEGEEFEEPKRHGKSKKDRKKEKKKSKKRKHRHDDSSSDNDDGKKSSNRRRGEETSEADLPVAQQLTIEPPAPQDNSSTKTESSKAKADFFAQLLARENAKPPVGTCHAVGKKNAEGESTENSRDWNCHKCLTSNYRHSHQCQKCKAMKRMSEWR